MYVARIFAVAEHLVLFERRKKPSFRLPSRKILFEKLCLAMRLMLWQNSVLSQKPQIKHRSENVSRLFLARGFFLTLEDGRSGTVER